MIAFVAFLLFIGCLTAGVWLLLRSDTNTRRTTVVQAVALATYQISEINRAFALMIPAQRRFNEAFAEFHRAWVRSEKVSR